jgi:hypothetical protein
MPFRSGSEGLFGEGICGNGGSGARSRGVERSAIGGSGVWTDGGAGIGTCGSSGAGLGISFMMSRNDGAERD